MTCIAEVLADLPTTSKWQEELYKYLHAHPEPSMRETETAAEIARRLADFGYVTHAIGGGRVGVLANGPGPTVLMRADIDALPVAELTGLSYASTATALDASGVSTPLMHACGHDVHITSLLGAAQLLATHRTSWSGTFIALFQPGEETAAGAKAMVDDGLVTRIPRPDVAFAAHVLSHEAGVIGTQAGPVLSAGDSIRITVFGKGSHGSMPHLSVDPVVLAAAIVLRLQTIVSRENKPGEFAVVTVGSSVAGTKSNIIPDRAVLLVNTRAYDLEIRKNLVESIERIVRAECDAARSPEPPTFEYYDQFPLTANDPKTTARVTAAFEAHFGASRVKPLGRLTASEDFSRIPDAFDTPYTYWGVGGFTPGTPAPPNHSPHFAPLIQPTLNAATEAIVVAVMAYVAKET